MTRTILASTYLLIFYVHAFRKSRTSVLPGSDLKRFQSVQSPSAFNLDLVTLPTVHSVSPGLPDHVHPSLSHHQPHQLLLRQQHGAGRKPRHVRPRRFWLHARGRWDDKVERNCTKCFRRWTGSVCRCDQFNIKHLSLWCLWGRKLNLSTKSSIENSTLM